MPADAIQRFIADPASGDFDELAARAAGASPVGPSPALARAAMSAVLASNGVAGAERRPVLALAADGESRFVDEVLATRGGDAGLRPIKPRGVDPVATRSWLAARQRDHRPALLVGPAAGFDGLLAPVERRRLKFRLPPGSAALVVWEPREAPGEDLRARLVESLGLTSERLWLGWEVEGTVTPFVAPWDGDNRFAVPHWVRVETDAEGRLLIVDLANHGTELRVMTEAQAILEEGTLSPLPRAGTT